LQSKADSALASLKIKKRKRLEAELVLRKIRRERPALSQFKNPQLRVFIGLQARNIGVSRIRSYTIAEKEYALALFYRSPSAYRHIRKTSTLPGISTIRQILSGCMATSGPCPILLKAVNARFAQSDDRLDAYATLGFDAMNLTEALSYHEHLYRIVGFEDMGSQGFTAKVANQELIAVLRGIHGIWKLRLFSNSSHRESHRHTFIEGWRT